jgi:chemotaxis protein MotB
MATFADLMSLLLCFFVLLLAFSTMDEPAKFEMAVISLRGAFNVFEGSVEPVTIVSRPPTPPQSRTLQRIARELKRQLQVMGRDQDVELKFDQGGLRINLPSQVLFSSGSAQLQAEAEPILTEIGQLLVGMTGLFIEVRGHTDNVPLTQTTRYRDNYDLSYGRAKSVAGFLNQTVGIPMGQLEMVPKGPSEPTGTNDTVEGRQANRRVELLVRPQDATADLDVLQGQVEALTSAPAVP